MQGVELSLNLRRRRLAAATLLLAGWVGVGVAAPHTAPAGEEPRPPNILIILTDDQRAATLRVMPAVRRWFRRDGTRFTHAFATTPQCCPSRASIFTGEWAHNHGVNNNEQARQIDHRSTIHAILKEAGYRTAISGKFLNKWGVEQRPPFFHRWAIFDAGNP